MTTEPSRNSAGLGIGITIAAAIAVAVTVLWWTRGRQELSPRFEYDIRPYLHIPAEQIGYRETVHWDTGMKSPHALAVGPEGRIFVVGDRQLAVFDGPQGPGRTVSLSAEPRCVAIRREESDGPTDVFVGFERHAEVFRLPADAAAPLPTEPMLRLPEAGPEALFTSIAADHDHIYIADARARLVRRYDRQGKPLEPIGRAEPERNIPGFIIPSPYFDLAVAPDGLLRVVDPGRHQIDAFTPEGDLELSWGTSSLEISGFCGCCNPSNLAIMEDGRVVTAEKGIPRVKIYSPGGELITVVVGPDELVPASARIDEPRDELRLAPVDVAVGAEENILVLDPATRPIRVFAPK